LTFDIFSSFHGGCREADGTTSIFRHTIRQKIKGSDARQDGLILICWQDAVKTKLGGADAKEGSDIIGSIRPRLK
jgi:hypothetical protein